jgi:hypothetical protein
MQFARRDTADHANTQLACILVVQGALCAQAELTLSFRSDTLHHSGDKANQ